MPKAENISQVIEVSPVYCSIHHFLVAEPVLISHNKSASETEVPGEESIEIEEVYILIQTIDEWPWNFIALRIHIRKAVELYITPIMSRTKREINPWSKIVNAGDHCCHIPEVNEGNDWFTIHFLHVRIDDVVRLCFVTMRQFHRELVAEPVAQTSTKDVIVFIRGAQEIRIEQFVFGEQSLA